MQKRVRGSAVPQPLAACKGPGRRRATGGEDKDTCKSAGDGAGGSRRPGQALLATRSVHCSVLLSGSVLDKPSLARSGGAPSNFGRPSSLDGRSGLGSLPVDLPGASAGAPPAALAGGLPLAAGGRGA